MMPINLKDVITDSVDSLEVTIKQIQDAKLTLFKTFDLNAGDFRTLDGFGKAIQIEKTSHPIIYIIEILSEETRNKLLSQFDIFRNTNDGKASKKLRHSKFNSAESLVMYVGSSTGSFTNRFKIHLGLCTTNDTYGMHLSKWDAGIEYTIRVNMYQLKSLSGNSVERKITEIIEQQIWDNLQPIFGKRSGLL